MMLSHAQQKRSNGVSSSQPHYIKEQNQNQMVCVKMRGGLLETLTLLFVFGAGFAFGWFILALIIIGEENEGETDKMGSFIIEIQNDLIVTPIQHFTAEQTINGAAKSAWYTACAYAAISSVARHVVMLMAEDGHEIKKEIFLHPAT